MNVGKDQRSSGGLRRPKYGFVKNDFGERLMTALMSFAICGMFYMLVSILSSFLVAFIKFLVILEVFVAGM